MPCPLIDGEDIVYYHPYDRADFDRKLRHYLDNPEEARRIAMNGFYKVRGRRRKKAAVCVAPTWAASRALLTTRTERPSPLAVQALRCHRWVNRVDYMMTTVAHLLTPGFKESGLYLKEAMMRTLARDYYHHTTPGQAPAGSGPPMPVAGAPEARRVDGGELPAVEAYRSRIADKVQHFEDAYWAMVEARNRSRRAGAGAQQEEV